MIKSINSEKELNSKEIFMSRKGNDIQQDRESASVTGKQNKSTGGKEQKNGGAEPKMKERL